MIRKYITTLAAAAAAVLALGAGTASAATATPRPSVITHDAQGLAGYYINESGNHRFRDIRIRFTVTPEMEQLGTGAGDGGVRQCNPNNLKAVDNGVIWTGTAFEAAYGTGTVSGPGDPCVTAHQTSSGPIPLPGNVNANGIFLGDVVVVESYYNVSSHFETVDVTDVTQDTESAHSFHQGFVNWYEAGEGVSGDAATVAGLVPPVANPVISASMARVTPYYATKSGTSLSGPWDLHSVSALNAASVPVLVPAGTPGSSFTISAGVS